MLEVAQKMMMKTLKTTSPVKFQKIVKQLCFVYNKVY